MVLVSATHKRQVSLRYGQVLFNVLEENWPDLAYIVRGDEAFDTYYCDKSEVIDRFTLWLIDQTVEIIDEQEK